MATALARPNSTAGTPEGDFVLFDNVCVFDEHQTEDGDVYDRRILECIARNNNARIEDTGDFCPVVLGHTLDPEDKRAVNDSPPILGFAGPFWVAQFGRKRPRWAIFAKFWIFPDEEKRFRRNPRRSVEIWPEERLEDRYFDPIAVMGAESPRRDLGMLYAKPGKPQMHVLSESDDGPRTAVGRAFAEQYRAVGQPLRYGEDDRWITIGGSEEGDKKHAGGTPVKINRSGDIVAGPQALAEKGIKKLSDFGDKKGGNSDAEPRTDLGKAFEQDAEQAKKPPKGQIRNPGAKIADPKKAYRQHAFDVGQMLTGGQWHREQPKSAHLTPKKMGAELAENLRMGAGMVRMLKEDGVYTDGRAMFDAGDIAGGIVEAAEKSKKSKFDPEGRKPNFEQVRDAAAKHATSPAKPVAYRDGVQSPNVMLKGDNGTYAELDRRYFDTINKLHPGAEWSVPHTSDGAVVARIGGRPVGVVMPMSNDTPFSESNVADKPLSSLPLEKGDYDEIHFGKQKSDRGKQTIDIMATKNNSYDGRAQFHAQKRNGEWTLYAGPSHARNAERVASFANLTKLKKAVEELRGHITGADEHSRPIFTEKYRKVGRYGKQLALQYSSVPSGTNSFLPGPIRNAKGSEMPLSQDDIQQLVEALRPTVQQMVDELLPASVNADNEPDIPMDDGDPLGMDGMDDMGGDPGMGDPGMDPMGGGPGMGDPMGGMDDPGAAPLDMGDGDADDTPPFGPPDGDEDDEENLAYGKMLARKFGKCCGSQETAQRYMEGLDDEDRDAMERYMKTADDDGTGTREMYAKCTGRDISDPDMDGMSAKKYSKQLSGERIKYRKLAAQHEQLKKRYARAEHELGVLRKKERYAKRRAALTERREEGFVLDIDDELSTTSDYSDDQFDRHVNTLIPERYSRVPMHMVPVDQEPAHAFARQTKADKYAKKAAAIVKERRAQGQNVSYVSVLKELEANGAA